MKIIETNENFTVSYEYKEDDAYFVDFKVYEIVAHTEGEKGKFDVPWYEGIDGCGMDDKATEDIEKANTYIAGTVKWDGCSHFNFGDADGYIHLCGKFSMKNLQEIIEKVYVRCGELMGNKILEDEFKV